MSVFENSMDYRLGYSHGVTALAETLLDQMPNPYRIGKHWEGCETSHPNCRVYQIILREQQAAQVAV